MQRPVAHTAAVTSPTSTSGAPSDAPGDGDPRAGALRTAGSPLTGRAAILFVVLSALAVSLALPVREYVRQRSEISALQDEERARQARVAELEARLEQWDDPAFVRTQARQRLQYVMPGEVGYVVLDPSETPSTPSTRPRDAAAGGQASWYARLWGSVQKADGSPAS
jgi:cell division protein FtsB